MRKNRPIGNQLSFEVIKAKLLCTVLVLGGGITVLNLAQNYSLHYYCLSHRVPMLATCCGRPETTRCGTCPTRPFPWHPQQTLLMGQDTSVRLTVAPEFFISNNTGESELKSICLLCYKTETSVWCRNHRLLRFYWYAVVMLEVNISYVMENRFYNMWSAISGFRIWYKGVSAKRNRKSSMSHF